MAKTPATDSISAYLAAMPSEARRATGQLRALIRAAAPKAVESRSYGILGYKIGGRPFLYCGGYQKHVAMYPVTAAMRRDHGDAIAPFQVSKGTLRFPIERPLPVALIKRLLKTRLKEMQPAPARAR
jgi:uncharacterized protein YdhG (YjbR/CyaY superfamily)